MKKQTWLWIIGGAIAVLMVGCFAVVGTGIFVVSRQMQVTGTDPQSAAREFEAVRNRFKDQPPILETGQQLGAAADTLRRLGAEYSGPAPQNLHVMAWDEGDKRLVRVKIPFWLLRIGNTGSLRFGDVDVDRIQLDPEELEQAGPLLLLDENRRSGRVLLWTE